MKRKRDPMIHHFDLSTGLLCFNDTSGIPLAELSSVGGDASGLSGAQVGRHQLNLYPSKTHAQSSPKKAKTK
jgi:hypothetical protein